MIVSIPHSGTRTLVEVLGERRFYHFHHDIEIKGVIHVPVREPLDHAVSWVCYEGSLEHANCFFRQFYKMLDYRDQAKFYRMEDYPKLKGFGPKRPIRELLRNKDYGGLRKEIPEFFEWMEDPRVREFYEDYYELEYVD